MPAALWIVNFLALWAVQFHHRLARHIRQANWQHCVILAVDPWKKIKKNFWNFFEIFRISEFSKNKLKLQTHRSSSSPSTGRPLMCWRVSDWPIFSDSRECRPDWHQPLPRQIRRFRVFVPFFIKLIIFFAVTKSGVYCW